MSAKTRYLKLMDRPRKGWKLADRAVFLRRFTDEALTLIEEGLARDGVVKIHDFGTFQLRWNEERQGRNPRTGAALTIPGQYRITFKPVAKLESRVNWPYAHLKPEFLELPPVRVQPKVEIPAAPPPPIVPAPPAIPLFEIEEEIAEPVRLQKKVAQLEQAEVRPPLSWSPASPPPARMRFDLSEEEAAPVESFAFERPEAREKHNGGNGTHDHDKERVVGEYRLRPNGSGSAPMAEAPRLDSRVRRPSFMQEKERDSKPGRFKWYAGFTAILLLLLLLFAKPIREQWTHYADLQQSEAPAPAPTTPPAATTTPAPAPPAPTVGFAGGMHQVVKGDNLWGISGHYYLDPYLWPNIYRVNSAKIGDPDVLEPQQLLTLPVLYGTYDKLTPQDRRNLAEGYFLVFNHYKQTQKHLAPFALWAAVRFDRGILDKHKDAIGADELAFLEAHNVGNIASR